MKILVINSGSSSIKYKLFDNDIEILSGIKEEVVSYKHSINEIFQKIDFNCIDAIAHRVVHGGEYFSKATIITNDVIDKIASLIPLAPLHNPSNLEAIKIIQQEHPNITQVAVFDTAFHQTLPIENFLYPIDKTLYTKHHIRKYGFHGTSHQYVSNEASNFLKKDINNFNAISLHLGNGDSITAIKNGKSIDTSMGFTPLAGLMMGTRSGDIDPSILIYLENTLGYNKEQLDRLLNKNSGFKGLVGTNNLKDILKMKENGDEYAKIAIDIFVKRVRDYMGSYIIELGNVDTIIFTGGIGENSSYIRESICKNLYDLIKLKIDNNKNIKLSKNSINDITHIDSKIKILVIKTNEEKSIAIQSKIELENINV